MSKPHILIAGAGIGGIAAALALVQHGFEVSLYEQVAELHELGAGLQISPNGSRVLCELGLRPAMEAIVSRPRSREMRLFNTGQSWPLPSARDDAGFGSPFWLVHRGDFHQTLVATLERSALIGADGVPRASGGAFWWSAGHLHWVHGVARRRADETFAGAASPGKLHRLEGAILAIIDAIDISL